MSKSSKGRYFEDFTVGETIVHATPRTVTDADATMYLALTGSRSCQFCSEPFARANGAPRSPIDDLLVFHLVFGKSVPDISINAIANLGYAEGRFLDLVYPGDTISARSTVIGKKQISSGKAGIVYVRTVGEKSSGERMLEFVRWVMVRKREENASAPAAVLPDLAGSVAADRLVLPSDLGPLRVDPAMSGSAHCFEDYSVGEKIDHLNGTGVTDAEHRLATRLYQNTARVHFDDHSERKGRLGSVIVYGGVIISLAKALSFNGLGNLLHTLAINSGTHANPCVPGDTVYAWSEVLDKAALREDAGAMRLRLVATKDRGCADFPLRGPDGKYLPEVLLDLDYWALMPRRAALERFPIR